MTATVKPPIHTFYLAGKISAQDWRFPIVNFATVAQLVEHPECDDWPVVPRAVLGTHHYAGPFFVNLEHHGATFQSGFWTNHGAYIHSQLVNSCLRAINSADVVFAWLDNVTCYGTLIELGYAKAYRKPIWVGVPDDDRFAESAHHDTLGGQLWFALEIAERVSFEPTAIAALKACLEAERRALQAAASRREPGPGR